MSYVPVPAPMAALRDLRRAAHWEASFDVLSNAVDAATDPMADMTVAWSALRFAVTCYRGERTARSWQGVVDALAALDVALAPFHGPSGWERPGA